MDPIKYMENHGWTMDRKAERKRYLRGLADRSRYDSDIAAKIGAMLIYNQVIEQYLVDIIDKSRCYIKADLWPVTVNLDLDLERATFGPLIEHFRDFALEEENRDQILSLLKKFNGKRNQVVHDLFDISDLKRLARELDDYAELADSLIRMLERYDDQINERFFQLEKKEKFRK